MDYKWKPLKFLFLRWLLKFILFHAYIYDEKHKPQLVLETQNGKMRFSFS